MSARTSFVKTTSSSFYLKPMDKLNTPSDDTSSDYSSHTPSSRQEASHHFAHSPSSFQTASKILSADYIFLNRKKTMDFLMTDNLLKHNQVYQKSNLSHSGSGLKLSGMESLNQTPRHSDLSASVYSQKTTSFPPVNRRVPHHISETAPEAVFDELVASGERVPKFVSPLSPKSLITHQASTSRDKTMQIIQNHNHRIYGMDHLNLKKINTMLKTKETQKASDNKMEFTMSNFTANKVHSTKMAQMRAEEENILKDYNAYEYNPLLDGFEFSGANMDELGSLLAKLTAPPKNMSTLNASDIFSSKRRLKMKTKTKSQTMTPQDLLLSPPASGSQSVDMKKSGVSKKVTVKPSIFTKERRGSIGDKDNDNEEEVQKLQTHGHNSARLTLKSKVHEETPEEQSKKIISQTYRSYNEDGKALMKGGSVKDNVKKIQNMCGSLEVQHKKMMNTFKNNKKEIGEGYNSLNRKVASFIQGPVTESLLLNQPS